MGRVVRVMYRLSLLCLALSCATLQATLKATPRRSNIPKNDCFVWEVEYHGGGLENPMVTGVTSPDQCQELCQDRQGCNYFTWVNSQHDVTGYRNTCWLKGTQGDPQPCKTCVSGPSTCGEDPTTAPPSGCCSTITISSSGDTPDYQWTRLGTYYYYDNSDDGRPMYRQDNNDNYLYYLDWLGVWYVNDNPLQNMGGLINWDDSFCPGDIVEDWSFYRWGDGEVNDWEADPTLKSSCSKDPPPTKPTTTTTTVPPTSSTHTPNPNAEPCTWGTACDSCQVWTINNGVKYCCAQQCDWGDVFVWTQNGEVQCECTH